MTAPSDSDQYNVEPPPRVVLYAFYALLFVVFIAVLVIVGVYGT